MCCVFKSMEKTETEESMQALRNLVLLVGSLSTCGYIELKPNAKTGALFQMPGFTVPQPSGNGEYVCYRSIILLVTIFICSFALLYLAVPCPSIHLPVNRNWSAIWKSVNSTYYIGCSLVVDTRHLNVNNLPKLITS